MEIIVSKHSGYCYGVKNAIAIAEKSIANNESIYSLGEIIHNKRAIEKLEKQGLITVDKVDKNYDNILFRSHGVEKKYYDFAKKNNINIIDSTCVFVKKIQKIVEDKYNEGYKIIIAGNKNHPEVISINSCCDYTAQFVENNDDIKNLLIEKSSKYVIVFQTTFNIEKYDDIIANISKKIDKIEVFNTICNATKKRQDSALKLSEDVDIMVVIGDKSSSNSKKLYEIVSARCKSIFIEDSTELEKSMFKNTEKVGITAGASTPDFVIEEVIEYIKSVDKN